LRPIAPAMMGRHESDRDNRLALGAGFSSGLNVYATVATLGLLSPACGFTANADEVAAANQLAKFISSDEGVALLASGYRASVNSLRSGRSWDSTAKQEPVEEAAPCA
jgi:hypothetical protein